VAADVVESIAAVESPARIVLPPWIERPYGLISWWDMENFSAGAFYLIGKALQEARTWSPKWAEDSPEYAAFQRGMDAEFRPGDRAYFVELLSEVASHLQRIGLRFSLASVNRLKESLSSNSQITNRQFTAEIENIHGRIKDELSERLFLYMPSDRAEYYQNPSLMGAAVLVKFPSLQYDIVEAGNCYAAGRSTAVVFHLMRIMEIGVQEFGNKLGVAAVQEKNWQNILDEINKAIRALPKGANTVEMAQAAANLYSVKVAWRNEVMHPNDTYTLEEAADLIGLVKVFMGQLSTIV
jgi:hypothetical protein